MNANLPRHIALQGALNFRDFGGYPAADGRRLRWRRLFRSDRLSALTAADYGVLDGLKIQVVCDLRRLSELERAPTRWVSRQAPELLHLPLLNEAQFASLESRRKDIPISNDLLAVREVMLDIYRCLVTDEQVFPWYARMLQRLAGLKDGGMLIHCSGGKDRTGVSCALIQTLLGVDRDQVFEDFMLSRVYYTQRVDLSTRVPQAAGNLDDADLEVWRPVFDVEPAYLETAFAEIESRYDSVEEFFVRGVGVERSLLERVREQLLEPAQAQ